MKHHLLSIIIPILNEAETIKKLLLHLIDNSSKENIAEIIVVDGGSNDGSQGIVKDLVALRTVENEFNLHTEEGSGLAYPKIKLIASEKGRAKQMNLGAKIATGDVLYFLHADALPPKYFDKHIINKVKNENNAGCFKMQIDHSHWWLRLASWFTQFSWRVCRGGDQSQFITKELFDDIGGFDERYIIYEDNILINELYARNEFVVIQNKIKTSARCYKRNGIWKLQYHFFVIYLKRWFGASAEEMHQYYKKHVV